ncbi:MAG: restriction endonuclease subunit S, partial [Candidatus Electrothrix sp. AR5]|nr:restriction endonuclease subunit S [Candidatus Electrothrix sp. AR5]
MEELISEHLATWTEAQIVKPAGGRGRKSSGERNRYGIKKLRELILELAVRGKLVAQDPEDEPASVLLERIAAEKASLIQAGKIKKQKGLPPISEEEKPFALPEGWESVRFGDLLLRALTGLDKGKSFQNVDFEYLYFKMNNILNEGGFSLIDITRVDATPYELQKYSLKDGDFLFNTRNSRELVGKTCVVRGIDKENVIYNNNILRVEFLHIFPEFIDCWFRSLSGKLLLEEKKSNTTNVCAIYQGKLFKMLCIIPPVEEQQRIVAKVDELMALCDRLEKQQTDSAATQQTLLATLL